MLKLAAILVFAMAAVTGQRSSDLTGSIGAIKYLDPAPVEYAPNRESIESKKCLEEIEAPRSDSYVKGPEIVLNQDTEIVQVEAEPILNYDKEEALVEIVRAEDNPENPQPSVFSSEDVEIVRVAAPYIRIEGDSIRYINRDEYKKAILLRNPETRQNIVQFLIPDTEPDKK